jgi:hypothetical protein
VGGDDVVEVMFRVKGGVYTGCGVYTGTLFLSAAAGCCCGLATAGDTPRLQASLSSRLRLCSN